MPLDDVIRFTISGPEWGDTLIARPLPVDGDAWGFLAPLRGTSWGDLLPVISGESLSHALHGWVTPLMNQIGRPPHAQLDLVPVPFRTCGNTDCIMADPKICHPCLRMPDCYEPPALQAFEARRAATIVVLCWKEGRYVVIVEGAEFSL